jgi:hypothetical protein
MRVSGGEAVDDVTGSGAELFRVRDAARTLEFFGSLLAHVTTESPRLPRWTTMDLYRADDGRYVLSVVGHSVVYHVHDGPCNSGVPLPASRLASDAEPCPRCRPPGYDVDPGPDDVIDMEEDYYTVTVCPTAREVVDRLKTRRNGTTGPLSRPAMRLLQIAGTLDDAFSADQVIDRL